MCTKRKEKKYTAIGAGLSRRAETHSQGKAELEDLEIKVRREKKIGDNERR